jgi:hypothetical protein
LGCISDAVGRHAISVEQEPGGAGGRELWYAEDHDLCWVVADDGFGDGAAKAACRGRFFCGDDAAGLLGCF